MSYESEIIAESQQEFKELQVPRNLFAQQWEEVAEIVLPTSRNTFYYGSYNFPGQKKTDRQVDSTGMLALDRFGAILDSLLTPRNMTWHTLKASNPYLMKNRQVRLYFEELTRILFSYRYLPRANFSAQNQNQFISLGAFGNAGMFIDRFDGDYGVRYKHVPMGELFWAENHQGIVDRFCRWYRLTASQAIQAFGPDKVPQAITRAHEQKSQQTFAFLHRVCPRKDYDPERYDEKGKLWASYNICLDSEYLCREGGYNTLPIAASRYIQTPGEQYGRGPAMQVLPTLKTLNAEKRDFLTQGHRAVAPVLLTADDGVTDLSLRPGAMNKGGWSSEGKPLVGTLPVGDISVSFEMMDAEAKTVNSAFLVDLFNILIADPKVFTATQVVEMMAQRGILIAPSVGRQQSEYLGPTIERELDVLSEQRRDGRPLLPPMPDLLKEAGGDYEVVYDSPLTRDMRANEVAGFQRTLQTVNEVAQVTQDPSPYDNFDFDEAIPAIAQVQGVPESWMASKQSRDQKRQGRAQAQQRQEQIQAAPAAAALVKAQAAAKEQPGA